MASIEDTPANRDKLDEKQHGKFSSLIGEFKDSNSFYEHILGKIGLENRQRRVIYYEGDLGFEEWLSTTFKEINDGKRSDCSIASKIYIDISVKDLALDLPTYVSEVVDTIGLESLVRERI